MRSALIIGMGTFGRTLAHRLQELGNEVMIVDEDSNTIDELSGAFSNAVIADCSNKEVLATLNVPSFDVCFVAIAQDFQASLEITGLLQELGAKNIISKAKSELQAKCLLKCGADEIIFPEKDIAYKLGTKFATKHIFDYLELSNGYGVFEIKMPTSWAGKAVKDLNVRQKHGVNILAIKKKDIGLIPLQDAEHVFCASDSVLVLGLEKDINTLQ